MNDLEKYFKSNDGRLLHKWHHYFEVYDRHFSKYRGKEVVIVEIGIFHGGSLEMWKAYFGDKVKVIGIDIEPKCKDFEDKNIEVHIGSQSDRTFLRNLIKTIPKIDILLDDGGHTMRQQIVTFEELYDHIKDDGVYLCEDCHTSYWYEWGGGYKRRGTFIEYSKNWIDSINAFHSYSNRLKVDKFTRSMKSIHYYDSIVVVEKAKMEKPVDSATGHKSFEYSFPQMTIKRKFKKLLNKISGMLNTRFYLD